MRQFQARATRIRTCDVLEDSTPSHASRDDTEVTHDEQLVVKGWPADGATDGSLAENPVGALPSLSAAGSSSSAGAYRTRPPTYSENIACSADDRFGNTLPLSQADTQAACYVAPSPTPMAAQALASALGPRELDAGHRMSKGGHFHQDGTCRPCFFFFQGGWCDDGADCLFCHMPHDHVNWKRSRPPKQVREEMKRRASLRTSGVPLAAAVSAEVALDESARLRQPPPPQQLREVLRLMSPASPRSAV